MKFELKYPEANIADKFDYKITSMSKSLKLGRCNRCQSFTKWFDIILQQPMCSEECVDDFYNHLDQEHRDLVVEHQEKAKQEIAEAGSASSEWKDIIIIVRNQISYVKECIESIQKNTKNYHLYIWDNASDEETKAYLRALQTSTQDGWKITVRESQQNLGFIEPNNELIKLGDSPYVILLNSDAKVFEHWDTAMLSCLKNNEIKQVGYWGGHLGEDGRGFGGSKGFDIDYVAGWCFCITRSTYLQHGLFDTNLKFAYCEDSDFSLRLKANGHKVYALHSSLVLHYQNKTVTDVAKEIDIAITFNHNHEYFKTKWKKYLECDRILLSNSPEGQLV